VAATTPEGIILEALLERYASLSVGTPALAKAYPRAPFKPTAGTAYLKAWFLPAQTSSPFIPNDSHDDYRGIFQIDVMWPSPETDDADTIGLNKPLEIAGLVADHFAKGTAITRSTYTVKIIRRASIGPTMEDAGWTKTPVSITYRAFIA
jgi:hypothetical protein